ncbi:reverse transcriptase domain-containing protein [Tanacetum coccineum]|uniref:Reverse transcriptase domain-containing protein n=1 Tax=Tanacetum coccineum TaxID=301880 RepID=A0ABQ5G7V0_9ASTR
MAALLKDKMNIRRAVKKAISEKNLRHPTYQSKHSRKTLDEPSTSFLDILHPNFIFLSKEPEQNPETSTEEVQNPNLENTAHVPPPEEEDSIFIEIPKPKAKKTVNVKIQDLNSPKPNSYPSKLPYPERIKIGLKDALVEMPKFNKWLSSLLRNKEKLEEIIITTVNAECSAIIMNKVPEKLEDPGKFLIPCTLQELNRTTLTPTRMILELANRSITHPMGIAEDVVVRVDGFTFLADFVVVNFEPDPRVPIILRRPFLRTAKALIDLYEEKLTLRVGKEELLLLRMKTSDNFEKFADELAPLNSLPPGNDDSTLKKDFHEKTFQIYSNPLFEFDDNFKSSNMNPLFKEKDKDVEIKSSPPFTLTSPKESNMILKEFEERDSIPPGIDLIIPSTLESSSSNPTSPTLTEEKVCSWKTSMFLSIVKFLWRMMNQILIRRKIICLLATYLHKKPKPPPQEIKEIEIKDDKVSSDKPVDTIVMPIRITFDNSIDFNDHFSKPRDFKKDLTVALDSTESGILPLPLLDSDLPITADSSTSITLISLGTEDKVFKPGIFVSHAIHDKDLVTKEKSLKENISSGTLLFLKEPSFPLPPPEPPDVCLNFEPNMVIKNNFVKLNEDFYQSEKILFLNVEDVDSFTLISWTFLPYFTYPQDSPLIFSFGSEDFVFDPGIVTFHQKPVAFYSP